MPDLWLPGAEGPHEELVARLHREIERFAAAHDIGRAVVDVELRDGARYTLDGISPEPGFGFVTLVPHVRAEDVPAELIVPIASIARIELRTTLEEEPGFGFSLPEQP